MKPYKGRDEEYEEARRLRRGDLTIREISERIDVPYKTVHGWVCDIDVDKSAIQSRGQRARYEYDDLSSKGARKKRLIDRNGRKCMACGEGSWMGLPIPLELHTGGDEDEVLCHNCHALTPDFRNCGV